MIFGTTVIDYDWPTAALKRTVTTSTVPPGLALYYGDEVRTRAIFLHGTTSASGMSGQALIKTRLDMWEEMRIQAAVYPTPKKLIAHVRRTFLKLLASIR